MGYVIGAFFLFVVLPLMIANFCATNTQQEIEEFGARPEDLPEDFDFASNLGDSRKID